MVHTQNSKSSNEPTYTRITSATPMYKTNCLSHRSQAQQELNLLGERRILRYGQVRSSHYFLVVKLYQSNETTRLITSFSQLLVVIISQLSASEPEPIVGVVLHLLASCLVQTIKPYHPTNSLLYNSNNQYRCSKDDALW